MKGKGRITKSLVLLAFVLVGALLLGTLVPVGEGKAKLSEILLTRPVFAQQAAAFPADEAGISAYINVGQTIDLAKAKNAMRGMQAEGSNYVIGIMELPGLPEEEFPHMYVSSDGWILAYYSKFAPASRIIQWYGYEGGKISTTTLQDTISKLCAIIGVSLTRVREAMGYYHFKYSEATKMVIAVDTLEKGDDSFSYSIPNGAILYEGSGSLCYRGSHSIYGGAQVHINGTTNVFYQNGEGIQCANLKDILLTPSKVHSVQIEGRDWTGFGLLFIYR